MANMNYCRFSNTLEDLLDCYENMDDILEDETEIKARIKLINLCRKVVENFEDLTEDID